MASNRMMQAIGTLERAISRLEQDVDGLVSTSPSSPSAPGIDPAGARAALHSLDALIAEMKGEQAHG